jgi:hypothetical protein
VWDLAFAVRSILSFLAWGGMKRLEVFKPIRVVVVTTTGPKGNRLKSEEVGSF